MTMATTSRYFNTLINMPEEMRQFYSHRNPSPHIQNVTPSQRHAKINACAVSPAPTFVSADKKP